MSAIWLGLPVILSALFGLLAPGLARHLPPQVATPLLSAGGLVAAAGPATSLALVAFDFVAQAPVFADRGRWSDDALRADTHVAAPLGVLALAALAVFGARAVRTAGHRLCAVRDAHRLAVALPGSGELSVAAGTEAQALAVPGRPGRIVVTTGLLHRLTATERRALLAHERAHLEHHHHLHQAAASIAAAANPLLRRLPAAVALGCERWADEEAARACSRDAVAATLVKA